jgi:branched-chain amino acid transport system substrate-binding protein
MIPRVNSLSKSPQNKFDAKRIAIMHDNTAFGKGLAEDTQNALKSMIDNGQITVVYFDAITPGRKRFSGASDQIKGSQS